MTPKAWKAIVLLLLLAGCAPLNKADYPQTCSIDQPDKDSEGHLTGGYTKGTFACALKHYPAPTAAPSVSPGTP